MPCIPDQNSRNMALPISADKDDGAASRSCQVNSQAGAVSQQATTGVERIYSPPLLSQPQHLFSLISL